MKTSLRRPALYAAGAVAASLFLLLCMLPYGRAEYLAPEVMAEQPDALRFRIASLLVRPFGAGAFLGAAVVLAWSVIAYFKESVGNVLPRVVGLAALVPSFCAMTSLGSEPREFWAGSVGIWAGNVIYAGFGPVAGWAIVGTLFVVSLAMATEMGFHRYVVDLRGALSMPLLRAEESGAATAVLEEEAPARDGGTAAVLAAAPVVVPDALPADFGAAAADDDLRLLDGGGRVAALPPRPDAGGSVTDAERALAAPEAPAESTDAADPVAAAAFFAAWDAGPEAPAAPVLDAGAAPALELADAPAADLLPSPIVVRSPDEIPESHARMISMEEIRAAVTETEELLVDPPAPPIPARRPSTFFSGVEFMAPSDELADAPAAASPAVQPEGDPRPAAAEPLPAPVSPASSAEVVPASASSGDAEAFVAAGTFDFEDEYFPFETPAAGIAAAPLPSEAAAATPVEESPASAPEIAAVAPETPPSPAAPGVVEAASAHEDAEEEFAGPFWLEEAAALLAAPAAEPAAAAGETGAAPPGAPALPESVLEEVAGEVVEAVVVDDEPADLQFDGDETADEFPAMDAAAVVVAAAPPAAPAVAGPIAAGPVRPEPVVVEPGAPDVAGAADAASASADEYVAPSLPVEVEDELLSDPGATPAPEVGDAGAPPPAAEPAPAAAEDTQEVLLRLFGDPVTRREESDDAAPSAAESVFSREDVPAPPPAAPASAPAVLDPVLAIPPEVVGEVHVEDEVFVEPLVVVDADDHGAPPAAAAASVGAASGTAPGVVAAPAGPPAPAEPPAAPLSAEDAASAVVACLRDLFGNAVGETPAEGEAPPVEAASPSPAPVALPLFPEDGAGMAAAPGEEETPKPRRRRARKARPEEAVAPAESAPVAANPPLRVVERIEVPPAEAEDAPAVDEDRVHRIVDRFRDDDPPADAEPEPPVAAPAPAPAPATAAGAADGDRDELHAEAIAAVRERGRGSVIVLQRRLGIGFTRASRILEALVADGILGPENGSGSHPVL